MLRNNCRRASPGSRIFSHCPWCPIFQQPARRAHLIFRKKKTNKTKQYFNEGVTMDTENGRGRYYLRAAAGVYPEDGDIKRENVRCVNDTAVIYNANATSLSPKFDGMFFFQDTPSACVHVKRAQVVQQTCNKASFWCRETIVTCWRPQTKRSRSDGTTVRGQ